MGYTSYIATYYKNEKVDRKAECDAYFMEGLNRGHFKVLKSVLKGSVYYAAIQDMVEYIGEDENGKSVYKPIENGTVWCAIFKTLVKGDIFYYKDMDETYNPYYYDCPKTILNLLSPTENEYALEWRKECWNKINNTKPTLSSLPVGTHIKWKKYDGTEIELVKHSPAYQFKRPFWMMVDRNAYISKNHIVNWEVVTE